MNKNRSTLVGIIFGTLFLILSIPKLFNKDWVDALFYIVAAIGFLVMCHDSKRNI